MFKKHTEKTKGMSFIEKIKLQIQRMDLEDQVDAKSGWS